MWTDRIGVDDAIGIGQSDSAWRQREKPAFGPIVGAGSGKAICENLGLLRDVISRAGAGEEAGVNRLGMVAHDPRREIDTFLRKDHARMPGTIATQRAQFSPDLCVGTPTFVHRKASTPRCDSGEPRPPQPGS